MLREQVQWVHITNNVCVDFTNTKLHPWQSHHLHSLWQEIRLPSGNRLLGIKLNFWFLGTEVTFASTDKVDTNKAPYIGILWMRSVWSLKLPGRIFFTEKFTAGGQKSCILTNANRICV